MVVVLVSSIARESKYLLMVLIGVLILMEGVFTVITPGVNDMPTPLVRGLLGFSAVVAIFVFQRDLQPTATRGYTGGAALLTLIAGTSFVSIGPIRSIVVLSLCVIIVYSLAAGKGPIISLLGSGPVEYGGRISFRVYMVHGIALIVRLVEIDHWSASPLPIRSAILLADLAVVIGAGAIMYRFVEVPCQRAIVGALARKRASMSPAIP